MDKDYNTNELNAIRYSFNNEDLYPSLVKTNEGIEYGEIQQQLPNQEINIIKVPREFIADKGEDIINFNYLPITFMGRHETHKSSFIKRTFYYL